MTVRLTVNDTITVGTVSILGLNTTPSINNNSISANLIIPTHIAIEEHVTFVITVKSNDGAQRKVTQKDLSVNDTIFVDTVAPRIYLIGAKNHAVLINSTNPFIPGAVVVDGDPDHPRIHSNHHKRYFEYIHNQFCDYLYIHSRARWSGKPRF